MNNFRINARKNPWLNKVEILLIDKVKGGMAIATDVVFKRLSEGEIINPTMTIEGDAAQELMDELWTCGIRPTQGQGSAGQLSATERHLKDMQRIVFKDYADK